MLYFIFYIFSNGGGPQMLACGPSIRRVSGVNAEYSVGASTQHAAPS